MINTYFAENSQKIKVRQASYDKLNHKVITDCRRVSKKKAKDSVSRTKLFIKLR